MSENTHGKNKFREVIVRCRECGEKQRTNMQCDTGLYQWDCPLCNQPTTHSVTEAEPQK